LEADRGQIDGTDLSGFCLPIAPVTVFRIRRLAIQGEACRSSAPKE